MMFPKLAKSWRAKKNVDEKGTRIISPMELGDVILSVSKLFPVLFVGRIPPKALFSYLRVPAGKVKPLWLTTVETQSPYAINPRHLYKLGAIIEREVKANGSQVIVDGIEYLIIENGLEPTLKFLGQVKDVTALHGSSLYVVASDALSEKEVVPIRRVLGLP
ncbi:DUF835 domain-containing protein [Thermococcus gorgonarius]|uniref:DUF835 domain-containing protein n=1 Tax=Thermococcus gorgonarius TaxID=71997 RepID=A0A2Z2M563_THEGO|nr:DUF835 domain-containing protein [Thermococcus gorgonarius]ASJ00149.1 hypothetical protein A3K92_00930 [Thermococcus gorgonarius]